LAETIKIADSYALGDPTEPSLMLGDQGQDYRNDGVNSSRQFMHPDNRNKRRDDRPDYRYGSAQVAAVDQDQLGVESCQHPRFEGQQQPWPKK
jgi:hypothetical protein